MGSVLVLYLIYEKSNNLYFYENICQDSDSKDVQINTDQFYQLGGMTSAFFVSVISSFLFTIWQNKTEIMNELITLGVDNFVESSVYYSCGWIYHVLWAEVGTIYDLYGGFYIVYIVEVEMERA